MEKVIELIVQVVFFSTAFYVLSIMMRIADFSVKSLIIHLLPLNYYAILYCTLYCLVPYLNILIVTLKNKKQYKHFFIVIFLLFLLIPTVIDMAESIWDVQLIGLSTIGLEGSGRGYTIVNFITCYFAGAALTDEYWNRVRHPLVAFFATCVLNYTLYLFDSTVLEYCNPLIIIQGMFLFLSFRKLSIKRGRIISWIASSSFTLFLIHSYFIRLMNLKDVVNGNCIIMLLHILGVSIVIILVSFAADLSYKYTVGLVIKKIVALFNGQNLIISTEDKEDKV